MGLSRMYVCIIVLYLIVTIHGFHTFKNEKDGQRTNVSDIQRDSREDIKILVVDTNMLNKKQQEARALLIEVLNNHADKNHCKQYALGFAELHRNTNWGCFKFPEKSPGQVLEGSYYTESSEYLELAVTIENPPGSGSTMTTHYFLFFVRKW